MAVVVLGGVAGAVLAAGPVQAASQGPCDIYASRGTPCVAAHSTTRALYGAYNGSLYQVRRSSDNTTKDIDVLSAGGYANAAAQDSFCAGTTCLITVIYDQSGHGNNTGQHRRGRIRQWRQRFTFRCGARGGCREVSGRPEFLDHGGDAVADLGL